MQKLLRKSRSCSEDMNSIWWISIWWKDGCKLTENYVALIHWHIFLATIENIWRKQLLLASLWIDQNCYHTGHFKKWDKLPNFHIPGTPSNLTFLVLKEWQKKACSSCSTSCTDAYLPSLPIPEKSYQLLRDDGQFKATAWGKWLTPSLLWCSLM